MNSRTLKLLTATTAFVAAASAGHAATVATSTTTPYLTSSSTAGLQVTGVGSIIATGSPAIEISNTTGSANIISVSTGGIVRSTTSATILSTNAANVGVVVNNSGTIANLANGPAIDLTGMTGGATVNNAGTISGSVTFGNGTNTLSSTGTTTGAINGGTGIDNVTFTGATHTGNVLLGSGANVVVVSASSRINGDIITTSGNDTITVSGSTVTGLISMDAGTDTLTVVNSAIGSFDGAAGADQTVTLTNSTTSGTINLGGTNDDDVLTINGANTFSTSGAISNVETINFDTSANINHTVTNANTIALAAAKTLNVNSSFAVADLTNAGTLNANENITGTGLLTNTGALNIAVGKTVQTGTYSGTGGTIGIGIASSTVAGQLILTGGDVSAPSLTINMGSDAGFIADGTSYTIINGTGTSTNATVLNSSTGVYRFSTGVNNGDISLTINRVSTSSVVANEDNKAIASALDTNTANTNAQLKAIHSLIGQQTTAAGVENIVESLAPSIDGAGMASVNVTVDTGNQISNRLASVRSTSGVATGDALASKHMWIQGFGSTVSQDDRGGNRGYDASAGGMSLGVDTDTMVDGYTTGLAFSYGRGKVDSNASSGASTDIDSYIATAYGSRVLDNGMFVNGQVAGGYNKYDMTRNVIGVGQAKGDTDGFQGSAKVEGGKDFAAGGFTLTPLASLQYTYLNMDKYTETGAGGASLTVDPEALSTVDAGAGGQLAYAMALSDGATLKPSVHAKYIYRMGDTEMGTTSSFTGGSGSFNTSGVKADRSSVNLGAGMLLTTVGGTDLSLNYDADIRSNLTGHTGQLKARWAF